APLAGRRARERRARDARPRPRRLDRHPRPGGVRRLDPLRGARAQSRLVCVRRRPAARVDRRLDARPGGLAAVAHADAGHGALGAAPVRMRVAGSREELDAGRPLRATACGPPVALPAAPVTVRAAATPWRLDHVRLSSPAARPVAVAPAGRVIDPGTGGRGTRDGTRVAVRAPAWLVLGESYDRGWRATCDGRDLGAPVPLQGYANGWQV